MSQQVIIDLPKVVIERIYDYQVENTTGHIILHFHEGRIQTYEFKQMGRVTK